MFFVVGGQVGHVGVAQRGRDAAHGGVLALTLLVGLQRGHDVLRTLARNHRHLVDLGEAGLVALDAVAAYAHGGLFLAGSGIRIESGIVVDERMRTNLPGVYAAGDVAEACDLNGKLLVNAIQPNAVEQARIAALNMAGGETDFIGSLAINVLDTMGLVSCSFGQWQGEEGGEGVELVDEARNRYLSLKFKSDVLIGATSIGWTEHIGALRGLIQTRARLGAWKDRLLEDPTAFMAAYLATAQKAA